MKDTTQTFRAPRLRHRLHQRREPRLLLLRVHGPRPCWRWARPPAAEGGGARDARRRRVADGPCRAPRHRHLPRPGRAWSPATTPPAVLDDVAARVGAVADAWPTRISAAPSRRGFAPASVRCSRRWACRAGPTTRRRAGPPRHAAHAAWRHGDDPAVQQRARTLAEAYLADPSALPPSIARRGAAGRRRPAATRRSTTDTSAELARTRRHARGVLPLLQRARLLPRSGARHPHAGIRAVDRRCGRRTRPALIALLLAQPASQRDRLGVRQGAVAAADRSKLGVFQGVPASSARSARSARRSGPPTSARSSRRTPCRRGARPAAGDRAHRGVRCARRAPVGAVRALARGAALGDWG